MDTTVPPSQAAAAVATTEDKTVAILCYVTILGFIAAIFMHQSHKTSSARSTCGRCLAWC